MRKEIPIPGAWGADKDGHVSILLFKRVFIKRLELNHTTFKSTTNPKDVITGGGLFPLGGSEENGNLIPSYSVPFMNGRYYQFKTRRLRWLQGLRLDVYG